MQSEATQGLEFFFQKGPHRSGRTNFTKKICFFNQFDIFGNLTTTELEKNPGKF